MTVFFSVFYIAMLSKHYSLNSLYVHKDGITDIEFKENL